MLETNITRRRAVQGAGAIGLAGAIGSTTVFAQEDGAGTNGEQAALRVVHASPDAPNVDVYATPADEAEEDGDGDPLVEDLGFSDVSDYNEVDAGSYQIRIVSAEGGGFLEDIFGDEEDTEEETALFEAEVEISEGTTYTAVAFGEIGAGEAADLPMDEVQEPGAEPSAGDSEAGPAGNETDSEVEPPDNETDSEVEPPGNETDSETAPPGNETDSEAEPPANGADSETEEPPAGETDQSFQVAILEDDLSAPGESMARVRVFHAVPDVGSVSISTADGVAPDDGEGGLGANGDMNATEDNGAGSDTNATEDNGAGGDTNATEDNGAEDMESGAAGGALIENLSYGESDTFEAEAGDYTLEIRSTGGGMVGGDSQDGPETEPSGNETEPPADGAEEPPADGAEEGGENVQEVEVTLDEGVVYSGFAVGYFNPEQATDDEEEDDGGLGGDSAEEFELVVVEDSQDGERSDGGSGSPLLSVSPAPQA